MSIESWDPFRRLEEFHRQTNQHFDELLVELSNFSVSNQSIAFQPDVDLVETPTEFRFYLSIPGLVEDDIVIDVEGRFLSIRGERQPLYDSDCRRTQLQEWRYGYFERRFELPSEISTDSIRGGYDTGVLTIVVGKLKSSAGDSTIDAGGFCFDVPDDWKPA